MKRFRWHRGSRADSLKTAQPCRDMRELLLILRAALEPYGIDVNESAVTVTHYVDMPDNEDWPTEYLVKVAGYGVAGMTDGPVE